MIENQFLHAKKRKYYDNLASMPGRVQAAWAYTKPVRRASLMAEYVWRYAPPLVGPAMLEVGCGIADLTQFDFNAWWIGLDISLGMLKRAGAVRGGLSSWTSLVQAAAETLPFQDKFFEIVVSDATYQTVRGKPEFLREVGRVLQDGGCFLLGIVGREDLWPGLEAEVRANMEVRDFRAEEHELPGIKWTVAWVEKAIAPGIRMQ